MPDIPMLPDHLRDPSSVRTSSSGYDALGRATISDGMKARIRSEFADLDSRRVDGRPARAALLILATEESVKAHFAARINGTWKVAAGAGFEYATKKPAGYVGLEAVW